MINIVEYEKIPNHTFGLGQDVSQNLIDVVRVPSLFIPTSNIHRYLTSGYLKKVTLEAGASQEIFNKLTLALNKKKLDQSELVTLNSKVGRKHYATGLIRAVFKGQRESPVITDWAASNYLSIAIGMGLIDLDYTQNNFFVTGFGEKAVMLYDNQDPNLNDFLFNRLLEYPYAAWLIRLVNKNKEKVFTKFDLGGNFGFIDEPGFLSLPEDLYIEGILDAKNSHDKQLEKQIKSNYESTSDKYMRWLAGTLVNYGLLKSVPKIYKRVLIDGTKMVIRLNAYKVTLKGIRAFNIVNGRSRYKRSIKRVRWEYFAPKVENSAKRKTARALMLKFLQESPKGLSAELLANKINEIQPSIKSIPDQILDDAIGLNRLGIEIEIKGSHLLLKEKLYDFTIPIKKNFTFKTTDAEKVKSQVLPSLKLLDHSYLQAIDIAFKDKTTNQENTQLEILSTDLFIKEMNFDGLHLGGSNRPDGFAYDNQVGWIIDSKAYHNGFAVTANSTDAMGRYIRQYRAKSDRSTWWKKLPSHISKTNFVYVSSFFTGNYKNQLLDFERRNSMEGGLLEISKLILLAETFKRGQINRDKITNSILDSHVSFSQYIEKLTENKKER